MWLIIHALDFVIKEDLTRNGKQHDTYSDMKYEVAEEVHFCVAYPPSHINVTNNNTRWH